MIQQVKDILDNSGYDFNYQIEESHVYSLMERAYNLGKSEEQSTSVPKVEVSAEDLFSEDEFKKKWGFHKTSFDFSNPVAFTKSVQKLTGLKEDERKTLEELLWIWHENEYATLKASSLQQENAKISEFNDFLQQGNDEQQAEILRLQEEGGRLRHALRLVLATPSKSDCDIIVKNVLKEKP